MALKDKVGFETKAMIGGIFVGIGLAMTIVSIQSICDRIVKMNDSYDAYKNREFTPIPTMIVDAEDIVTVVRGEDGSFDRKIEFDQYLYYEAVRCNRQEVGRIGRWQKGVEEYLKEGCGDVADLNADQGKGWLALYTVKSDSEGRGYPILADSLLLAYGEKNRPKAAVPSLHFFLEEGAADLADKGYCFKNRKGEVFFTWSVDTTV